MTNNLAVNLRTLCSYYSSISQVTKLAKINRQQFNKYLGGQSSPSLSSLRKINDFFGLEEDELFLPPEEFKQLVNHKPRVAQPDTGAQPLQELFNSAMQSSDKSQEILKPYHGLYHDYYCSPSNPGKVLRALISVYEKDNVTLTKSIERLPYKDKDKTRHFNVRYHGFVQAIRDRLVFTDIETLTLNNWGQRIYYPANRTRIDLLPGLTMAISGGLDHRPFCSHAVLEKIDDGVSMKQALQQCSLFSIDSPEIRDDIKEKLHLESYNDKTFMTANG
ncbi:helix-turn-helix domain-containing protein [Aliamphritea ceti]|uniref:helix-turn-helix domain-containing protein n=1 Tax=Aliamphritea ceti TaxID=1524258 RepID=UPI0021C49D80|nr:helix-turn-helix transcriptional regulator [Aliamphritea ceti]